MAPNCVKLAEIAPNYPKLQKIASNCFELRHENLKKIKNLHASTQKIAEIGRNCLKLPPIAWNWIAWNCRKLPKIASNCLKLPELCSNYNRKLPKSLSKIANIDDNIKIATYFHRTTSPLFWLLPGTHFALKHGNMDSASFIQQAQFSSVNFRKLPNTQSKIANIDDKSSIFIGQPPRSLN